MRNGAASAACVHCFLTGQIDFRLNQTERVVIVNAVLKGKKCVVYYV